MGAKLALLESRNSKGKCFHFLDRTGRDHHHLLTVKRSYCDIDQKRMTTRYLHLGPQLVEPVELTLSNGSR